MEDKDLERTKQIEKQVERWDLFAKIAPTLFLMICFGLLIEGSTGFDTIFLIGMVLFSLTAVVWWFWTIFSIRHLIRLFYKANVELIVVGRELSSVREELNNEKNRRG